MIPKQGTDVQSNLNGFETAQFSIAVNNKSFRVLLDTLYTNKVKAVTRELWTNAYDSHIMAGIENEPFVCKLPTILDPTFAVRDFGVSLSHEQVMELYTTVFKSTKENTNTQVGQLGLGSKSPFAYTDSFTVTAWQEGYKRTYIAAIGNDGVPTITHMMTEESDEPTGLEVSFPVQAKHFYEFQAEAQNVAEGFDIMPTIIDGDQIVKAEPEFGRKNWRVYKGRSDGIRQGCVIYPINKHQLDYEKPLQGSFGIIIDVPIGTVDIAANREALSLDDDTAAAVKAAFSEVAKDIAAYVQEQINESKNLLEAEKRYHKLKSGFYNMPTMYHRKQPLTGYITFKKDDKLTPVILGEKDKIQAQPTFAVANLENLRFIIDRTKAKVPRRKARIKRYMADHKWSSLYIYTVVDPTPKQLESLVRRLGLEPKQVIPVASLPDIETFGGSQSGVSKSGVYSASEHNTGLPNKVKDGHEMEDDWYWVGIEKGVNSSSVYLPGGMGSITLEKLPHYIRTAMAALDIDHQRVYYLTQNARKRFDVQDSENIILKIKEAMEDRKEEILGGYRWAALHQAATYGTEPHLVHAVDGDWLTYHASYEKMQTWLHNNPFASRLWYADIQQAQSEGRDKVKELREKFPLLFGDKQDQDHIINYIVFCKENS